MYPICVRAANALMRLCICPGSSELSMLTFKQIRWPYLVGMCFKVLGHLGHELFSLGSFGLDISATEVSATEVSATENAEGGRFGHNHKFWVWDVCMHKCVLHFIIF